MFDIIRLTTNLYPTLNCHPVCSKTQAKYKESFSSVDVVQSYVTSLSSIEIETRNLPFVKRDA